MGFDRLKNSISSAVTSALKVGSSKVDATLNNMADAVDSANNSMKSKGNRMIEVTSKVPFKDNGEIVVLEKGANITVATELKKVACGIEWDEVKTGPDFDADVSCLIIREDTSKNELVYYGQLTSKCGAIEHTGDNLTGADDAVEGVAVNEDDETIVVDLTKLTTDTTKVVFFTNIHAASSRNQNFGTTGTMGARLYNADDAHIFMEADLMEDNATQTSIIIGEFYRKDAGWKYKNMAQGGKQELSDFANSYK